MDGDLPQETVFDEGGGGAEGTAYQPSEVLGDQREAIVNYLQSEIRAVRDGDARAGMETKWQSWRKMRRAIPESSSKSVPWTNASNVASTLMAQKVQAIFAKEIGAFALKKPPCTVSAMNPDDRDLAESMTKFFTGLADSRYGLNMRKNLQDIFYDQASLGTKFVKIPFLDERWSFKKPNAATGAIEQISFTKRLGPAIQQIKLEDFFTQPFWKDIQSAPWCAVRTRMFKHEITQAQKLGAFDEKEVEVALTQIVSEYPDNEVASLESRGISVDGLGSQEANAEIDIYECYVYWDVDGDGIVEDIRLFLELESGAILRSEYNPLAIRDIEPVIFMSDPDSMYGIGVCELTEQLQQESTTLRNMRIDGIHLSMLKMFTHRTGAHVEQQEFRPFMSIPVDDHQDLKQLEFGDNSASCVQGEMIAKDDADRLTGASDYMTGFNDKTVGSGASVGGTMFLAQQANSILNAILQEVEQSITNIYQIALHQCIANRERVDLSYLALRDQDNVRKVLEMRVEEIPTRFRFTVKATDITKTEESKKTDMLALAQVYAQYGQQAVTMAQIISAPETAQVPLMLETVQSLFVGATMFMSRVIESFDAGNPADYLPFIEQLKLELKAKDMVREQQARQMEAILYDQAGAAQGAGGGAPGGVPQPGGMGGVGPGVPGAPSPVGAGVSGQQVPGSVAAGVGPVPGL